MLLRAAGYREVSIARRRDRKAADCASAAGRVWLIIGVPQQSPGPTTPPAGALVVPAGANKGMNWNQPGATFWFAQGVHTFARVHSARSVPATARRSSAHPAPSWTGRTAISTPSRSTPAV